MARKRLHHWKKKMEAIIAGVVDYDDVEDLVMSCAAVADKAVEATAAKRQAEAKAMGKMDITPLWSAVMGHYFDVWLAYAGDGDLNEQRAKCFAEIVRCGEIADAVEMGTVAA
jgi:hypothetical protein